MLAFTAAALLTPYSSLDHGLMLVEQRRFVEVTSQSARSLPAGVSPIDLGSYVIAPGYLDLHIHGSAGYDVMDDSPEALPAIERLLSRHGVTSYLPTTVSASIGTTLRALERLANAIEAHDAALKTAHEDERDAESTSPLHEHCALIGRAQPLGIHLEGPFISHARRGVHSAENLLPPKLETFERFWQAARGHIRMITIAPELDGALELIAAVPRGACALASAIPMRTCPPPNAPSPPALYMPRTLSMPCVRLATAIPASSARF